MGLLGPPLRYIKSVIRMSKYLVNAFSDSTAEELSFEGVLGGRYASSHKGINARTFFICKHCYSIVSWFFTLWLTVN